jgi:GNAT superfamily N-acetyltransferase
VTSGSSAVVVRPRTDADLEDCVALAAEVHARDGYPRYGADDLPGFLTLPDALGVWVAVHGDEVVGHVALRPTAQPPQIVEVASRFLDRPAEELCAVTRLLVAPSARRLGVGVLLLETAVDAARARRLVPVLGVDEGTGAVAFYERRGWRRVAPLTVRTPSGEDLVQVVYVAPA